MKPIGRNANFLQLGGDSLQAVELLANIDKSFGIRLDLSSIFGNLSRLTQLAELINVGSSGDYAAPRNNCEMRLSQLWERYFGVRPISVSDNFFELGGDPALAAIVMAEVSQQFDRNLSAEVLHDRPTIKSLAELLRGASPAGHSPSLIVVQASGTHPPLICVPGILGTTWWCRTLARCLGPDFPIYACSRSVSTE